jgi:hypothetical protein
MNGDNKEVEREKYETEDTNKEKIEKRYSDEVLASKREEQK